MGFHWHTWTKDDAEIKNTFDALYRGVGYTNATIQNMEDIDFEKLHVGLNKESVLAELKVYRAWYAERYHSPADDLQQPWDPEAAAKFNAFYAALVEDVANAPERPRWLPGSQFGNRAR